MRLRLLMILLLFFGRNGSLPASEKTFALRLQEAAAPVLDGHLDELIWRDVAVADDFLMHYPFDDRPAVSLTEARIFYTSTHLIIGVLCRNADDEDFTVQSLKRDFDFTQNDAFSVILDPYGDAVSGYNFTVNPYGAQSDGILDHGGISGGSDEWDTVWEAEVFRNETEHWWSAEIAVPFKSLRFNDSQSWRINFARNNISRNEISVWSPVPRGTNVATLVRAGILLWDKSPPADGSHTAVIPYVVARTGQDYVAGTPTEFRPGIGADAKTALNSSLYLDLTVNPDFSQTEIDRQVIDLSRFELNFPEKRLFFLENNDLFANLGNSRVRPFFSRRLGGVGTQPVPILFGARLSGRLSRNWRIGLMNVQTEGVRAVEVQAQNYSVAVLQRSILQGSNVTAFLTNRHALHDFSIEKNNFNRVGGVEFDYRSADSKWSGKSFLHYAFTPEELKQSSAWSTKLRYRTAKFNCFVGVDAPSVNYLTDFGFVPHLYHRNPFADTLTRIGYKQVRGNGYYRIFARDDTYGIDFYGLSWSGNIYTDPRFKYLEHDLKLTLSVRWLNQNQLSFSWGNYAPVLFFPFEIDGLNAAFPPGSYRGRGVEGKFATGLRGDFFGSASIRYGGEYTGRKLSLAGSLNYRRQPWGLFGLTISQESLSDFPDAYGSAAFTLIGGRAELSFSRNLFLTVFLQYNTQINNFNLNTRLQWRIKPMSDLFLIYTDNYRADNIRVKDRALVLKASYWFGF